MRYAVTICSTQGKTIQGHVIIHESDSIYFGRKHVVVSISRATSSDLVSFAD